MFSLYEVSFECVEHGVTQTSGSCEAFVGEGGPFQKVLCGIGLQYKEKSKLFFQ